MLNRSQTKFLLLANCSQKNPNNPFFCMPKEIIQYITYSPTPDPDFLAALKEVTYAQLEPLRTRLELAKNNKSNPAALQNLLLQAGDVITPAGLLIKGTTLLECAICAGDPEIAAMIKPYFLAFQGGEKELIIQLEYCQSAINEMQTKKADDLNEIMSMILASNLEEVEEELKTENEYDWNYSSPLRDALNQFRKNKLDPKNRHITTPKMHCNYQNLIHAYEILDTNWKQLKVKGSIKKNKLFAKQIIGLIQVTELTALDRQLFAQSLPNVVTDIIPRSFKYRYSNGSFKYRYSNGSFPDYDKNFINDRVGCGFTFFVSIYGRGELIDDCIHSSFRSGAALQSLYQIKISNLSNLCSTLITNNETNFICHSK